MNELYESHMFKQKVVPIVNVKTCVDVRFFLIACMWEQDMQPVLFTAQCLKCDVDGGVGTQFTHVLTHCKAVKLASPDLYCLFSCLDSISFIIAFVLHCLLSLKCLLMSEFIQG